MNNATKLSNARRATMTGLTAAAVGIAILVAAGVDMPVVPPAMVLLLAGAILVGTVHRRWALVVGMLVGLIEIVGLFASGSAPTLVDFASVPVSAGNWVRLLGSLVAVIAAAMVVGWVQTAPKNDSAPSPTSVR